MVSADGTGIVSQAGGLLLTQALRVTGLDRGLAQALEQYRGDPSDDHHRGKVPNETDFVHALPFSESTQWINGSLNE